MDSLVIAGRAYSSRLLVGTGKYKDFEQTRAAVEASGANIVTVAIRRTNIGQNPNEPSLLDAIPDLEMSGRPRTPVAGEVANPLDPPAGCAFHPRCPHAKERCRIERPELNQWRGLTRVACHAVEEGRIGNAQHPS